MASKVLKNKNLPSSKYDYPKTSIKEQKLSKLLVSINKLEISIDKLKELV